MTYSSKVIEHHAIEAAVAGWQSKRGR